LKQIVVVLINFVGFEVNTVGLIREREGTQGFMLIAGALASNLLAGMPSLA